MGKALLIIDYQNDFTPPEGALAVAGGDEIAAELNEEAGKDEYDVVIATRDWHPPGHSSFESEGGPWPEHCVQGSEGAELHPALDQSRIDVVLDKGHDRGLPGYSAFEREGLSELLREREIEQLAIGGLATDVCVKHTALDGLEEGFDVEVIRGATRGVDPGESERALQEIKRAGGKVR